VPNEASTGLPERCAFGAVHAFARSNAKQKLEKQISNKEALLQGFEGSYQEDVPPSIRVREFERRVNRHRLALSMSSPESAFGSRASGATIWMDRGDR